MKYAVVLLLIAVFALGGALYATAAPSKPLSNSALTARISALTNRVKSLQREVNTLGLRQALITTCELPNIWSYAESIKSAVKFEKPYLVPEYFQPACP